METIRKGMLLVISGPSGTGKGTLIDLLRAEDPSFAFSVSATTREPRQGEVDGVHYHFMTQERYDQLVEEDAFLEYARVHTGCYGTLKSEVYERMEQGQNVLLDIDVQGALNVMKKEPECVSVFILPPSYKELRRRLVERGTETPEQIEVRMNNARKEIALKGHYQYQIINGELTEAYALLKAIVQAEKQNSARYCPVVPEE